MRIKRKGVYEFDTDERRIVVFTEKNIKLMRTIINNDSSYRLSFDTKYKPSSAGFLHGLGHFPQSEEGILKAVTLIDKENSTHLSVTGTNEGSGGGRQIFAGYVLENRERICEQIKTGNSDIVQELSEKPVHGRYNISFASKFCTYINRYCFGGDDYSIVDSVLCQVLPAYEAIYLGKETKQHKWERQKEEKNFDYGDYHKIIGDILERINKSEGVSHEVTRQEFDLFLWYYYKGSPDRVAELYQAINE